MGVGLDHVAQSKGRLTLGGPTVYLEVGVGIGMRKNEGSLNALIRKWFAPDAAIS